MKSGPSRGLAVGEKTKEGGLDSDVECGDVSEVYKW